MTEIAFGIILRPLLCAMHLLDAEFAQKSMYFYFQREVALLVHDDAAFCLHPFGSDMVTVFLWGDGPIRRIPKEVV